ncbi:MAG: DUF192 domain-containing protein [Patescibacteria group bacterium]|nr:DUF192 domain-containing protein [Patescibacteria group bacterium]MDD5715351.1 DUF192 domain-containing protein [Patescibacteria group bacterium]
MGKPIWVLIVIAIIVGIIFWAAGGSSVKNDIPFYLKKIVNETAQVTIGNSVFQAEVAKTAHALTKGLKGRDSLAADRGMLFVFDKPEVRTFTMQGMQIPLDMIWINNGAIAAITEEAQPGQERVSAAVPSQYVLEIRARTAETRGFQVGDLVNIVFDK